jgi:16S rRNA (uracil1498-N3)-methyltransferase
MNVILINEEEILTDGRVVLQDRRSEHIITVLRCKVGDRLKIGIINDMLGSGRILEIEASPYPGRVVLSISASEPPPAKLGLDLILALPRPIMLKKILAQAASMGVGAIHLINANRVEKSFFSAKLLQVGTYRQYLHHGLEQSVDTGVPQVVVHSRFRPFVEDTLPALMADGTRGIIAHPGGPSPTALNPEVLKSRLLLAVGPEGGWVEFELAKFREQGFVPVGLGQRILKVDTAVVALLAQLSLLLPG